MKSQFPLAPDVAEGALKSLPREQLIARAASAEAKVAHFESEREQAAKDETVIKSKMEVGLTREQAKAVIHRQREHGAARQTAYDEARAARLPALKK